MGILAIESPVEGADEALFTPELRAEEARRAWNLYQAGRLCPAVRAYFGVVTQGSVVTGPGM